MNIKNFDSFRIDAGDCCFMDVSKIGKHSNYGFMTTAYLLKSPDKYISQKVEVRKKDNKIALISYKYGDLQLPEYWRDAEILFSWEETK